MNSRHANARQRAQHTDWALYFVTDTDMAGGAHNVPAQVTEAIEGGAHVIQVRDKNMSDTEYRDLARAVQETAREAGARVGREIVVFANDRVEVARELGLDIHVGQSDMPAEQVRAHVGVNAIIGVSVSTRDDLDAVINDNVADVVGIGPIWDTATKTDTDTAVGLEGLTALVARARDASLRSVAIGGISIRNAGAVAATGVDGICVVSAIAASEDPALSATFLRREFVMNQPE